MTAPERLALGGVRSATHRYDQLPAGGPARDAALDRLRAVIAADVRRTIGVAIGVGWHALDHGEISAGCERWWRGFVEDAVADGVFEWRQEFRVGECSTCGAVVEDGRCWGCGRKL